MPRNIGKYDALYTMDDQSYFDSAYMLEMYIKSVDGFSGDGDFMSKFGLEIRDQIVFSVAQRVFTNEVGGPTKLVRPREGDLIYYPLNQKCFQIKYVNQFEMFYQLGALQTWEIRCELFEYSNEKFSTGIDEIDAIQKLGSTDMMDYALSDENGTSIVDESGDLLLDEKYDLGEVLNTGANETIKRESMDFVDWSVQDPFSEYYSSKGK